MRAGKFMSKEATKATHLAFSGSPFELDALLPEPGAGGTGGGGGGITPIFWNGSSDLGLLAPLSDSPDGGGGGQEGGTSSNSLEPPWCHHSCHFNNLAAVS